jgi:ATP-dependent DNA helicase PIF1
MNLRIQGWKGDKVLLPVVQFINRDGTIMRKTIFSENWQMKEGDQVIATRRQIPLALAWQLPYINHRMSLDIVEMDLGSCFASGQAYVALSPLDPSTEFDF